jgi:hypothetical protein
VVVGTWVLIGLQAKFATSAPLCTAPVVTQKDLTLTFTFAKALVRRELWTYHSL